MDRANLTEFYRTCASGELSKLDERVTALVARMALAATFALFEP